MAVPLPTPAPRPEQPWIIDQTLRPEKVLWQWVNQVDAILRDGSTATTLAGLQAQIDAINTSLGTINTTLTSLQSQITALAALIDVTQWSTYTPSVTSSGGALNTYSASGRYKQYGKTVWIEIKVNLISTGSAAGTMLVTLPTTVKADTFLGGRKPTTGATELPVYGYVAAASNSLGVLNHDSTTVLVTGDTVIIGGVYEAP